MVCVSYFFVVGLRFLTGAKSHRVPVQLGITWFSFPRLLSKVEPARSHRKFTDKHSLPFPLLADDEKKIVEAYGLWVEKSMYGKKYFGTERSTFVIGPDGRITAIFRKVKPGEHITQLLGVL